MRIQCAKLSWIEFYLPLPRKLRNYWHLMQIWPEANSFSRTVLFCQIYRINQILGGQTRYLSKEGCSSLWANTSKNIGHMGKRRSDLGGEPSNSVHLRLWVAVNPGSGWWKTRALAAKPSLLPRSLVIAPPIKGSQPHLFLTFNPSLGRENALLSSTNIKSSNETLIKEEYSTQKLTCSTFGHTSIEKLRWH